MRERRLTLISYSASASAKEGCDLFVNIVCIYIGVARSENLDQADLDLAFMGWPDGLMYIHML